MDTGTRSQGEGSAALAFCIGGAFAAVVLLPLTQLLDLKAAAAMGLAALLLLGFAEAAWRGRKVGRPQGGLLRVLGLGLVVAVEAQALSPYHPGPPDPALLAGPLALAAFWLGPRAWGDRALGAWTWATVAVAGYALAQRLGVEPLAAYAEAGSRARAMGTYGNPGCLAAFLCLSWPLFLAWKGPARAAALALAWSALLATQSRAGVLALGLQLLLWGGQAWRRGWRPGRRAVAAAVALLLAGLALAPPSTWSRPTLRLPLWRASWGLWLQRPWLGWGPGTFALAFQDHAAPALVARLNQGRQFAEDPHQLLLAVACGAGALGLAALLAGGLGFFWAVRGAREDAAPLWLGVAGLLLQSQADRFFFQPGVFVPLCAGFGMAAWRPQADLGLGRPRGALVFLVAAGMVAWAGSRPLLDYRRAVGADLGDGAQALAPGESLDTLLARAQGSRDAADFDRLGAAYAGLRRYPEASAAFTQALALGPSPGRAQNLGNCAMMLGDPAAAEAAFRRAVSLDPGGSDAHFSLGYALYDEKRLKDAVDELDEALRLDPANAGARTLREQILR